MGPKALIITHYLHHVETKVLRFVRTHRSMHHGMGFTWQRPLTRRLHMECYKGCTLPLPWVTLAMISCMIRSNLLLSPMQCSGWDIYTSYRQPFLISYSLVVRNVLGWKKSKTICIKHYYWNLSSYFSLINPLLSF